MKYEDRMKILKYMEQNHSASITKLAILCQVTLPTMRKYLRILHDEKLLNFKHGRILALTSYEFSFIHKRFEDQKEAKKRIGKIAGSLVKDGDTIFIGGGSTTLYILDHILDKENLTIVTNSIHILNKMVYYPHIKLICAGGQWRLSSSSFQSILGSEFHDFHPDKSFIGVVGLDFHRGVTQKEDINNGDEFLLFKKAKQGFLLADYTKFKISHPWVILGVEDIKNIITDQLPFDSDEWKKLNIDIFS